MIHLYEKVPKSEYNLYGIREHINDNPFLDKPCIVTIIALPMFLRDINGSMRQVAELVAPDIDVNDSERCHLLGLGFGDYNPTKERFSRFNPTEEELDDFVIEYFVPLVSSNGSKIDVELAMRQIRNVNFLTYCNGADIFHSIEECFKTYLHGLGYSLAEMNMILSQICVAAISGNVLKKKGTSTLAITFGDVNDRDFENPYEKAPIVDQGFISYDSSIGFRINGDGRHDFKKHMTGDEILSSKIKTFLETAVSIDNFPITYEKMDNALANVATSERRNIG